MKAESVTREIPEARARGRILAYMAPPPSFVKAAPLHHRSALIVGEMGSGKTTFIEAKLGEAARLLLEDYGVDDSSVCYVYGKEAGVQQLLEDARGLDVSRCSYLYLFNDDAPAGRGGHGLFSYLPVLGLHIVCYWLAWVVCGDADGGVAPWKAALRRLSRRLGRV